MTSTDSATDALASQPSHEHDRSQCAPTVFDLSTTPRSNHLQEVDSGDAVPDGGHLGAIDLMNAAIADGRMPDLRCGALARANRFDGLYRHAVRAASVALLLIAVLLVDGYRLRHDVTKRIGVLRNQQEQVYRRVISQGTLPHNPATRIASERKRIEALASTSSSDSAVPHTARAQPLDDVRAFVEALPSDVRILVNELVVDAGQFNLRGHTVSHRDAERIADAVATIDGVSVRPPRTSRLKKGGVEFSVRGKRNDTQDD